MLIIMKMLLSLIFLALNFPAIILATELADLRQPLQTAIVKIAIYLDEFNVNCNLDCAFCVFYANDILNDLEDSDDQFSKFLNKYYLERIMKKNVERLILSNSSFFDKSILQPNLMKKTIKFNRFLKNNSFISVEQIMENCTDWYPCVDDFFSFSAYKINKLNESCSKFLNEPHTGYSLTHQLFYLQLIKANKVYEIENFDMPEKIEEYCTKMFAEGKQLMNRSDSKRPNYDLLMEFIIFCGYEGYEDFFQPKWIEYILDQQTEIGCFTVDNIGVARKRNLNVYPDGCADHTTGLALVSLSLVLNFISKM